MSNTDVFGAAAQGTSAPGLDRAAIESLIAKQYTGLRLLITRRTGNAEVAEDLLNEAASMSLLRNYRRSVGDRGAGQFSDAQPRTTTCAWARTRSGIWRDR